MKMLQRCPKHGTLNQQGFTLIELMVVVAIITVIASIAIPNYRNQLRDNAEIQAQQQMLSIANQLSSWRAKRLSYSGFVPRNQCADSEEYCYSATDGAGQIYVPIGSDSDDYRYIITLVDAQPVVTKNGEGHLVNTAHALNADTGVSGKGWRMLATSNASNRLVKSAKRYSMNNTGQRCQYDSGTDLPDLSATTIQCEGIGISSW